MNFYFNNFNVELITCKIALNQLNRKIPYG